MIGEFGLTFRSSPDGLLRLLGDLGKPGTVVVQTARLHNRLHEGCVFRRRMKSLFRVVELRYPNTLHVLGEVLWKRMVACRSFE